MHHIETDGIFIVDEYTQILTRTPLSLSPDLKIAPIFRLGLERRSVMLSGHESEPFTKFLKEHFKSLSVRIHGSYQSLAGSEIMKSLKVFGCQDENVVKQAFAKASGLAATTPVILYVP